MRRRGLAFAVGLLAAFSVPSAAHATVKAIWGPVRTPDGSSAFPVYKSLGVDVFQIQLRWDRVAPTRPAEPRNPDDPAYIWPESLDEAVREARRNGIEVAILVARSPRWANGDRQSRWAPRDPADFARFVYAASRRYRSVHRWMIWGEPSRAPNFQPLPFNKPRGPRVYARLLDRAYGALKRRSRRNIVIGGMTFSFGDVGPGRFIRWMRLPSGKPPRLDEFGHNPVSRRFPNLRRKPYIPGGRDFSDLDLFIREVRRAYRSRHSRPKLWLSEFTISSDRPNRAFDYAVSRAEQARWLKAAYRIANRKPSWISGLGWFALLDDPASEPRGLTTGLMTYEGERKPAFDAYRRAR